MTRGACVTRRGRREAWFALGDDGSAGALRDKYCGGGGARATLAHNGKRGSAVGGARDLAFRAVRPYAAATAAGAQRWRLYKRCAPLRRGRSPASEHLELLPATAAQAAAAAGAEWRAGPVVLASDWLSNVGHAALCSSGAEPCSCAASSSPLVRSLSPPGVGRTRCERAPRATGSRRRARRRRGGAPTRRRGRPTRVAYFSDAGDRTGNVRAAVRLGEHGLDLLVVGEEVARLCRPKVLGYHERRRLLAVRVVRAVVQDLRGVVVEEPHDRRVADALAPHLARRGPPVQVPRDALARQRRARLEHRRRRGAGVRDERAPSWGEWATTTASSC